MCNAHSSIKMNGDNLKQKSWQNIYSTDFSICKQIKTDDKMTLNNYYLKRSFNSLFCKIVSKFILWLTKKKKLLYVKWVAY